MPLERPAVLPLFPLTGVLLLPRARITLHIFEPRYRNMVTDVLRGSRCIGMVQPLTPQQDNRPDPDPDLDRPNVFEVGCAGFIEVWERLPEDRFMILVRGLSRFRIRRELPLERGYRLAMVDYEEFDVDALDQESALDHDRLSRALSNFAEEYDTSIDVAEIDALPSLTLLNLLAMSLPFAPVEKQALLEAADAAEREAVLFSLLDMGLDYRPDEDKPAEPN